MSNDSNSDRTDGKTKLQQHPADSDEVQFRDESPYEYEIAIEARGSAMGASAVAGAVVARRSPDANIIDASGWQEDSSYIVYVYVEYDDLPDVTELWNAIEEAEHSIVEINRLGEIVES